MATNQMETACIVRHSYYGLKTPWGETKAPIQGVEKDASQGSIHFGHRFDRSQLELS
ncbi:hypothetical protein VCR9J2_20040 [Vibrio crassostreae]|nr:hypothetical protein VCR9J2_20040 [Vibrio crassostreae]